MDVYSWFRRSVSNLKNTSLPSTNTHNSQLLIKEEEELQLYGITDQLIEFVKSLSIETFKNFPLPDEAADGGGGNDGNVRKDLSDWQEKHAMLVLSKVKELSQLRFRLCPRYLKEREFWRIYFSLARRYITEYELRAVRLEKLKNLSTENGTVSNTSAYEVEMLETKHATSVEPATYIERNLDGPQS